MVCHRHQREVGGERGGGEHGGPLFLQPELACDEMAQDAVEQDLFMDSGADGIQVHQCQAGVGCLLAGFIQHSTQTQQAFLGGGIFRGNGVKCDFQRGQQVSVFCKRIPLAQVFKGFLFRSLDLPGLEAPSFKQLLELAVGLNHIALAQKNIAFCVENVPGQGFANSQCPGGYSYQ